MKGAAGLLAVAVVVTRVAALGVAGAPASAAALSRMPVETFHPRRLGPHTFFGTIVGMRGSQLVIKRRNGRLQNVDATQAIADNAYSMPLFVGKTVAIDGTFTRGVFSAAHIFRITSLDALASDR
jgi:hypothetical protein